MRTRRARRTLEAMADDQHLTTNRAVSTRAPDRVCVDEREDLTFTVTSPDSTATDSISPEQLYASALASCLHQAVAIEATKLGVSTNNSRVHAAVTLTHDGSQRFDLQVQLSVELPDTDASNAQRVKSEAIATCPPLNGIDVTTDSQA